MFHNTTSDLQDHSVQDQDQDRFFWSQTGLVRRPTVSDHIIRLWDYCNATFVKQNPCLGFQSVYTVKACGYCYAQNLTMIHSSPAALQGLLSLRTFSATDLVTHKLCILALNCLPSKSTTKFSRIHDTLLKCVTVLERMATLSSNLTELFANCVNFYKHRIFRIKKRILSK